MSAMCYILDEQGQPVTCDDLITWSRWIEAADRHVGFDQLLYFGKKLEVSTVFLGLDHRYSEDGPPILWETMLFLEVEPHTTPPGPAADRKTVAFSDGSDLRRYTSREEAIRSHRQMVEYLGAFAESRHLFGDPARFGKEQRDEGSQ